MGKKTKKTKKTKNKLKNEMERRGEILIIMNKMNSLGLSTEYPGVKEFYLICKNYIVTGEGSNGKVKLLGLKRIVEYILTTRVGVQCRVNLKYDPLV